MSKNQLAVAVAMVTLLAPDGATELSIGSTNYTIKDGEVEVPLSVAHHAYAFGYTNKPLDRAEIEAETERVRQAQTEMDDANAAPDGATEPGHIAAFLARPAKTVIADIPSLSDAELAEAEAAEVEGKSRETVADAIAAERTARAAK